MGFYFNYAEVKLHVLLGKNYNVHIFQLPILLKMQVVGFIVCFGFFFPLQLLLWQNGSLKGYIDNFL